MYTAEEKAQIRQLEDRGATTWFTTTIKEVPGGFIINHSVAYVINDEVVGQTREERVCSGYYNVVEQVAELYGDPAKDMLGVKGQYDASRQQAVNSTRAQAAMNAKVAEPDRYASHTSQPGG